ncbi:helix-turn-helix domain-containing protein [Nocardioides jensenii]|uniref:helix-turn-helix domain-containing protein n=1 Tax=Nocardioides jensenii TaxID=1843 RepID=UPI000A4AFC2F|nr:helix-turn-helix transcriptional regulator [Nocardioides jensenii]
MPASVLAPYVASLAAYDVTTPEPGIHRGLPSPTLTFVLPVDEPLEVSWAGEPGSRTSGWSSVSGLHDRPAHIHHGRRQAGVQLALTPLGARALLGVPLGEVARALTGLDELGSDLPLVLRRLPEQVNGLADARDRVRLVERSLVEALVATEAPAPRAEVGHALARLTRGIAVHDVAEETGCSRRHLTTMFRAECGVTPKTFQRIARFATSRQRWADRLAAGDGSLADLAAGCGYADQSHLTREWNALAGCTPTTWAREEFPFVQDAVVDQLGT